MLELLRAEFDLEKRLKNLEAKIAVVAGTASIFRNPATHTKSSPRVGHHSAVLQRSWCLCTRCSGFLSYEPEKADQRRHRLLACDGMRYGLRSCKHLCVITGSTKAPFLVRYADAPDRTGSHQSRVLASHHTAAQSTTTGEPAHALMYWPRTGIRTPNRYPHQCPDLRRTDPQHHQLPGFQRP
jgi:hypothetical protein